MKERKRKRGKWQRREGKREMDEEGVIKVRVGFSGDEGGGGWELREGGKRERRMKEIERRTKTDKK